MSPWGVPRHLAFRVNSIRGVEVSVGILRGVGLGNICEVSLVVPRGVVRPFLLGQYINLDWWSRIFFYQFNQKHMMPAEFHVSALFWVCQIAIDIATPTQKSRGLMYNRMCSLHTRRWQKSTYAQKYSHVLKRSYARFCAPSIYKSQSTWTSHWPRQ